MLSNSVTPRFALALMLSAPLVMASDIGGSDPAAAFGFGRFGGFGRGPGGLGAGRGNFATPSRGNGGALGHTNSRNTGASFRGGKGSGHHSIVGSNTDRNGGSRGGRRHPIGIGIYPGAGVPVVGGGPGGNSGGNGGGGNVAGGGGAGGGGRPPRGESRFVLNEVITSFRPNATPRAIAELARRYNLTQLESQNFPLIGTSLYRWRIGGRQTVGDAIGGLEDQRIVSSVQPNYVFKLQEDAGKTSTDLRGDPAQYVLGKLEIVQAHRVATGKHIAVALIDSEIDANNPNLDGAIAKTFDALGGDDQPDNHGTAMAGAIAAHATLLGIAPDAQLLSARAFGNAPGAASGTSYAIYKGLQWAADNGARVVNMSFAGPSDPTLHRILAAAYANDMVLIAAAGNAGPKSAPLYPASDPNVIAVTATDSSDKLFAMANRGSYVAVAAPGVEILALAPGRGLQVTTGTSVATAHISGIAALLLELQPSLKAADVRAIITTTAKLPASSGGQASDFGAGLANAYRAVTALSEKSTGKDAAEQIKQ